MRINRFIAQASGLSRRAADDAIANNRVHVNGQPAQTGQDIQGDELVALDGTPLTKPDKLQTILLHKPAGYVVSRNGQGSKTIYELLPSSLQHLKPIGRLDKDSSGLLLLTNDGALSQQLTHPSHQKPKVYEVTLGQPLAAEHRWLIAGRGVLLTDGPSKLVLAAIGTSGRRWRVTMSEGRNRQIRRTFASLGYNVTKLHRTTFGDYTLQDLQPGAFQLVKQ